MPVASGPRFDARTALAASLVAIAIAAIAVLAIVVLSSDGGGVEVSLGDDEFNAGPAEVFSDKIAEDRRPIAYASLAGADRPVLLNHVGFDPDTGWVAVIAVSPTKGPDCLVDWDLAAQDFYETCDPDVRFPATGDGLDQVPVIVENGDVIVDLNATRSDDTGA